jgi:hypothetical protein
LQWQKFSAVDELQSEAVAVLDWMEVDVVTAGWLKEPAKLPEPSAEAAQWETWLVDSKAAAVILVVTCKWELQQPRPATAAQMITELTSHLGMVRMMKVLTLVSDLRQASMLAALRFCWLMVL